MKIKIFIFSVLSFLIVLVAIFSNINNNNRLIYIDHNNIINKSVSLVSNDSIFNYLKFLNVVNDSMTVGELDLLKIQNQLNNIQYVRHSNAFIGINSSLNIEVVERKPIIELKDLNMYLDEKGIIVPKSHLNKPNTVKFFGNVDSTNYNKISKLGLLVVNDSFLKSHINYIFSDSTKIFIKSNPHDYLIELGSLRLFRKKLLNYKFFYLAKYEKDIFSQIEKINLSYDSQVIVEKK